MTAYVRTTSEEKRAALTADLLRSILNYDKRTGAFTWRARSDVSKAWNTRYAGREAGCEWSPPGCKITYRVINIMDYPQLAHQLAWLYVTGEWSSGLIDHEDGNGLNNRWRNLRAASRQQNSANSTRSRRNKSGFKGVCKCPKTGRWRANIGLNGKQVFLGNYDTPEEAHAAYVAAAKETHGAFARAA